MQVYRPALTLERDSYNQIRWDVPDMAFYELFERWCCKLEPSNTKLLSSKFHTIIPNVVHTFQFSI